MSTYWLKNKFVRFLLFLVNNYREVDAGATSIVDVNADVLSITNLKVNIRPFSP